MTGIEAATERALLTDFESPPDVDGELSATATDLDNDDPGFVDRLERRTVTASWEQRRSTPVNESLDVV